MCFPFHTTQNMATSHVVLPLWGIDLWLYWSPLTNMDVTIRVLLDITIELSESTSSVACIVNRRSGVHWPIFDEI